MRQYLLKRIGQVILTLFIYISLVYFIIQAMPGDITNMYLQNPKITPEVREALRHQLGLDRSPFMQYLTYIGNFFTGNLGISFSHYPRPVWDIIVERLPRTVVLFLAATVLSFYFGLVSGRVIAWKRGGLTDYASTVVGVVFYTAFYPLLAFILTWFFGFTLGILPINQFIDPTLWRFAPTSSNQVFWWLITTVLAAMVVLSLVYLVGKQRIRVVWKRRTAFWSATAVVIGLIVLGWWLSGIGVYGLDIFEHMILPVFTLTLVSYGGNMLMMRDSMLDTIREDYVMAARAKGLPDKVVRDKYAARTAILPVITNLAINIGFVVSGGIVTETVFSWPGLGRTLFEASISQDYPLAMGAFAFTGIFVLVAHLVADILYAVLDPRITYARGAESAGT